MSEPAPKKTRLETLMERRKQIDARIQRMKSIEAAKGRTATRAAENKRKILVGAFILEQMERDGIGLQLLTYSGARFDAWLTRKSDRVAVGFEAQQDE